MEESLRYFGSRVDSLIRGQSISRSDAREMFRQVLLNEQPDLQQGAFLAAITAKVQLLRRLQVSGRPSMR
jgi:anthranilate phosphoribosyltransferase